MRILKNSALALTLVAGGLALSQAKAAPDMAKGPQAWIERMCSDQSKGDEKAAAFREQRAARLATLLQLNDSQKAALKDLEDARAKARADHRAAFCAKKPDLSSLPGRLAFREQMMQNRLDAMKAETPKLLAFYNSLDDKQKAAFDTLRGGMMGRGMGRMMGNGMMGHGMMGHGMMGHGMMGHGMMGHHGGDCMGSEGMGAGGDEE